MNGPNGAILYQGPSVLDGGPIVAIVTGLARPSANPKTGQMLQSWIMRADVEPHAAVKAGDDVSVCGTCPLRPAVDGGCYVRPSDSPLSVWRAWQRGVYQPIAPEALQGRLLRMGSYGDPVAVPYDTWRAALATTRAHTGYTHQWRLPAAAPFRSLLMASTSTADELIHAESLGWRAFHVGVAPAGLARRTTTCPSSDEAGKRTTCARCRLCNGTDGNSRVHISIAPHGWQKGRIK